VSTKRVVGTFTGGLVCIGSATTCLVLFSFIASSDPVAHFIRMLLLAIFVVPLLLMIALSLALAGILLLWDAVSHLRGTVEIREQGLVLGNIFSTASVSWNNVIIYSSYNAFHLYGWYAFCDLGTVLFVDTRTGKRKMLWPYLFPGFAQIMGNIEREMAAQLIPRLSQALDSGLSFGEIKITRNDLLFGQERLPCSEIREAKVVDNDLMITACSQGVSCSRRISLKGVPNTHLLRELLKYLGTEVTGAYEPIAASP
jgi:hypothetical protein